MGSRPAPQVYTLPAHSPIATVSRCQNSRAKKREIQCMVGNNYIDDDCEINNYDVEEYLMKRKQKRRVNQGLC
jgi:hypothetical protein